MYSNALHRPSRGLPVDGSLLRRLRQERGWTQEQAAEWAGVSDRLIRRAEAGCSLEATTVQLLADLYSHPDRPCQASDLVAGARSSEDTGSSEGTGSSEDTGDAVAVRLLKRFLRDVWSRQWREAVLHYLDAAVVFRSDAGTFHGHDAVLAHVGGRRHSGQPPVIELQELTGTDHVAAVRWELVIADSSRRPPRILPESRCGVTSVQTRRGRIVEAWEHWDPWTPFRRLAQGPP